MPSWLGAVLDTAYEPIFTGTHQNERCEPVLRLRELGGGAYFRPVLLRWRRLPD